MAASFTTPYSPIIEEGVDGGGGCGCFRRFCFGRDEGGYLLQEMGGGDVHDHEEAWLVSQIKKLKQLSELVAGPKWKNFIRKIGRLCQCHHKKQAAPPYHYTPETYALNFAGDRDEEEDGVHLPHSFSVRFAPRVLNDGDAL